MNDIKLVRITNITQLKQPPGHFIDFAGFVIGAGKSAVVDLSRVNQEKHPGSTLDRLEDWTRQRLVKVVDASDGTPITAPEEAEISRGTQTNEVADSTLPESDAEDFEEGFDPAIAKEASMPHMAARGGHMPNVGQVVGSRSNVSLSGEEPNWDNTGTSPIPGARPVNVDNMEQFTLTAPRTNGPGGVVTKK